MEHNSHPGLHQLFPSSQDAWVDPLACPALTQGSSSAEPAANFQQSQQYHRHDRRKQENVGAHGLDLIYNASTQAPQNRNPEWPSAQRVKDLLNLTSQSLLPLTIQSLEENSLQDLADKFAKYKLTIRIVFQSIQKGRLNEARLRLLEASEWLLGNIENLGESNL